MLNRFRFQVIISTTVWPNDWHTIAAGPTLKKAEAELARYRAREDRLDVGRQLYLYDALQLTTMEV